MARVFSLPSTVNTVGQRVYSLPSSVDTRSVRKYSLPSTVNTVASNPPSVSAGIDQTVEPWETITLSATSSTGSVTWSKVSGPSVGALSGLTPSFSISGTLSTQTLVLRATVTNSDGTATDDVTITILPANRADLNGNALQRVLL